MPTIAVEGPRFYSQTDEAQFHSWLESIPSVRSVGGVGTIVEIQFSTRRIRQQDLREILALFHRYKLNKRQLVLFDRKEIPWFRDPKKYWYKEIFGKR